MPPIVNHLRFHEKLQDFDVKAALQLSFHVDSPPLQVLKMLLEFHPLIFMVLFLNIEYSLLRHLL
jgi:hypothetical protein